MIEKKKTVAESVANTLDKYELNKRIKEQLMKQKKLLGILLAVCRLLAIKNL